MYNKNMEQMKYINSDEFEEILKERYNQLTAADIISLLNQTGAYVKQLVSTTNKSISDRIQFISSVATSAIDCRKITYKQWKALSAFCSDCRKELQISEMPTKSF
jgi:hypothetical protein